MQMSLLSIIRNRVVRFFTALLSIVILSLGVVAPAVAAQQNDRNARSGYTMQQNDPMDSLKKAEKKLKSGPRGMKEVQSDARKGPNSVQGRAETDEMNNPQNSQDVETVPEKIKEGLKKITGDR